MTDKVQKIREKVERIKINANKRGAIGKHTTMVVCDEILSLIDSLQEEPVSKVWHDPDEEPEVERTIIWEDEKMMGKHLFQGQWRPKIDIFGRKERWCYLSDILNL